MRFKLSYSFSAPVPRLAATIGGCGQGLPIADPLRVQALSTADPLRVVECRVEIQHQVDDEIDVCDQVPEEGKRPQLDLNVVAGAQRHEHCHNQQEDEPRLCSVCAPRSVKGPESSTES
jgi:hypothetical protein